MDNAIKHKKLQILAGILLATSLLLSVGAVSNVMADKVQKKKIYLSLSYFESSEQVPAIHISARQKIEKKRVPIPNLIVNLYINKISKSGLIGTIATGVDGKGVLVLPAKFHELRETSKHFKFIARVNGNPYYKDRQSEMEISIISFILEKVETDSLSTIIATLDSYDSRSAVIPASDVVVKFYVERMFGLLPIGGDYTYTDEYGIVKVDFPIDLPGDENALANIVVRLEDDELFGNIERRLQIKTQVASTHVHLRNVRALWGSAANAPLPLVIVSLGLIVGLWGTLAFLVRRLYIMHRLGKEYHLKQKDN